MAERVISKKQIRSERRVNCRYVRWRGVDVEIPEGGYEPGGTWQPYSEQDVASTLKFYYDQLTKGNWLEALNEHKEDNHHPSLLNVALATVISEDSSLIKKLDPLLRIEIKRAAS